MKDSFILYTKYEEQISLLSDAQAGILFRALLCYQSEKSLPEMDSMTNLVFTMIRQQIDFDNQKYDDICRARSEAGKLGAEYGKLGGRPSKRAKTPKGDKETAKTAKGVLETPYGFSKTAKTPESESDTDNDTDNRERKKEIDKDIISISACACETIPDFASMTDEELVAWGEERPVDFTDSDAVAFFEAWMEETAKREKEGKKWSGKITREGFERLKSHAEVMTECSVSNVFRKSLESFLRHCYANGHLVTNDKLMDIINRLDDACGSDDEAKCGYIQRAISGGFFDVIAGKFISPAEARK